MFLGDKMLEDTSVVKLYPDYNVRILESITTPSGCCEKMELTLYDINSLKAVDVCKNLKKIRGFVNGQPIRVTRDEKKVYRFTFLVMSVLSYNSEMELHRYAISAQ